MHETELVIYQIVHIRRHGEVDMNVVRLGIIGEFPEFGLHDEEARRVRLVHSPVMIDKASLASPIEEAMIGYPQCHRHLAAAQDDVTSTGREVLGIAEEILYNYVSRIEDGQLLEKTG